MLTLGHMDLRQSLVFLDAMVLNKPEVMVGQVASKVDATTLELTDKSTREFLASQLQALTVLARKVQAMNASAS